MLHGFLKFWVLAGTAGVLYISLSNWIRRFNDINGSVNKNGNIIIGSLAVIGALSFMLPFGWMLLFSLINSILFLTLVFKKVKLQLISLTILEKILTGERSLVPGFGV